MRRFLLIILLISLLFSGCAVSQQQAIKFPFELMLGIPDLSLQFEHTYSNLQEIEGGVSYEIKYAKVDYFPGSIVDHQISIYQDPQTASENYFIMEKEYFNDAWVKSSELFFSPHAKDDIFRMGCMDLTFDGVPTKSCQLLQLHNNLVIMVIANINEKNIDF